MLLSIGTGRFSHRGGGIEGKPRNMWGQGGGGPLGPSRHGRARTGTPSLGTLSEEDEADVMDEGDFIRHLGCSMEGSKGDPRP